MNIYLQFSNSLEPLFLAATALGMAILAIAVYRSNKHSATNIIFILLSLSMLLWLWSGYMAGISQIAEYALVFHRLAIFFAAPMSTFLFLLAYTIPNEKFTMKRYGFLLTLGATVLMMAINISPYAFTGTSANDITNPIAGPGMLVFGVISSLFSILAIYHLFRKYFAAEKETKRQSGIVLVGIFTMLLLIIGTILVPIVVFQSGVFLPFLSLYALVFLSLTAYAITKYHLFNTRVIIAQAITVVIWVALFSKIFITTSIFERSTDILIFLITLIFGVSLIRSVRREIEERERIEMLNTQLDSIVHLVSHEVKGALGKSRMVFNEIIDGDYGTPTPQIATLVSTADGDVKRTVDMVMDILNSANLKRGTLTLDKKAFDLKDAVQEVVAGLTPEATSKGLYLRVDIPEGTNFMYTGDKEKIVQHVLRNLVDNSIRYTPTGEIVIGLSGGSKNGDSLGKIIFSVKDTGVGITEEDMPRMFTEGGKGHDSTRVNVHSTGYGLYFAKVIVEAHGGKIWVESEGKNKGSQFYVEFK